MKKKASSAPAPRRPAAGRSRPSAPATVEDYLRAQPDDTRAALERLRKIIRAVVPAASEVISYQIPTFKQGRMLVGFAASKHHCTFHVMSTAVMRAHSAELEGYDVGKGSIRFAADRPLPAALVKKLVRARLAEDAARDAGK